MLCIVGFMPLMSLFALCLSSLSAVTSGAQNQAHLGLVWCDIPVCGLAQDWLLRRREALLGWELTATMAFYKAPNDFFLKNMVHVLLSGPSP